MTEAAMDYHRQWMERELLQPIGTGRGYSVCRCVAISPELKPIIIKPFFISHGEEIFKSNILLG